MLCNFLVPASTLTMHTVPITSIGNAGCVPGNITAYRESVAIRDDDVGVDAVSASGPTESWRQEAAKLAGHHRGGRSATEPIAGQAGQIPRRPLCSGTVPRADWATPGTYVG